MRQRLLLMHDVARWKWNEGKPIADPDRERQLLAKLEKRGESYGLARQKTTAFMTAQIEAGKLVQESDFATWEEQGQDKFSEVRDLSTELRPLIDELSDRMLAQLAKSVAVIDEPVRPKIEQRANVILRGEGIDEAVRAAAIQPLLRGPEK
jgi:chorismate mutase